MTVLSRSSFGRGWVPDADAVNGPIDGLLRMDNLTLDEVGVVAVRAGSAKLYSALADLDVHSLFTGILNGSRYRMAGAGSTVYANGSSLSTGVAGSGDIQFGSHLGQILIARSTTKKKWDGATLRTWGIAQTGGTPTVAAVAADKKVFASCDLAEAPAFSYEEDDGSGPAFASGVDGSGNGSILLNTNATTSRGTITKLFAGATNFTAYDGGTAGTDDDLIQVYVYITDPTALLSFRLMVDVSAGDFTSDYYFHDFTTTDEPTLTPRAGTALPISTGLQATDGARVRGNLPAIGTALPRAGLRVDKPVANAGWSRLLVRRGDMTRFGTSSNKDWTTVRAVRLVVQATAMNTVAIDDIRIISNAVVGRYKWCVVLVNNNGTYTAKSAPSSLSAETQMQSQGATITVPADASRDSQVNEAWLFRGGGAMDSFYRTAVKTGVSGVGSFTISDALSDIDAMTVNIKLETDNATPPDTIIDIEGPYYDRVFALTATHLYPSRRLNPDSFASGQVVRVSGVDETALWVKKALGGLYIGTTKDIYRLDGTGAELPDGTIDFIKTPLNVDHPPIADGVAQDGNLLIFLADDGWRTLGGAGSTAIAGDTSLLYQGKTRHGVSPVNLTTGRFRAAIWKGQFVALTPEGSSTTSSTVLYRHVPQRGGWQRHVYTSAFRCVYREPDGTLLASDTAGFIWQLGTGTQDDGANIPIEIWTKVDDDGQPFNRKDPIDLRLHLDTGGVTATVGVYLNGSASGVLSVSAAQTGVGITSASLEDVAAFRQMQLKLTATVNTFRLIGFGVQYTPLPMPVRGILTPTDLEDPRVKTLSGFQLRIGTFGAQRSITPIVDGVDQPVLLVTSGADDPSTVTYQFTKPVTATEVTWAFDGDVEIYAMTPLVTTRKPLGVKSWDSGPLDLGRNELTWLRGMRIKMRAGADLTVTPYFDAIVFPAVTVAIGNDVDVPSVFTVWMPRGYKGRVPRLVITSTAPFYPYWIQPVLRSSGSETAKDIPRIPIAANQVMS